MATNLDPPGTSKIRAMRAAAVIPSPPSWAALLVPSFDATALVLSMVVIGATRLSALSFVLIALGLFAIQGDYRSRISLRVTEDVARITADISICAVIVGLAMRASGVAFDLLLVAPVAVAAVLAARAATYAIVRRLRRAGVLVEPTLIVGAGTQGANLVAALQEHKEYGLLPVGFLDSCSDASLPVPVLGDIEDLAIVVRERRIRRVIVAFGPTRSAEMIAVLRDCADHRIDMHVLPRLFELGAVPSGRHTDEIWGVPLLRVQRPTLNPRAWRMKRLFDVCVATSILVLASPILVVLAIAVRLSSPGPVLFRQTRIGQHGRPFQLLKFRSMRVNGDSDTTWTVTTDARRTRLGQLMRRLSLDELPQLFNVLRGDMSMVGPRPERPHFAMRFSQTVLHYGDRHRVPVGLTGWAQIHGLRGDCSIEERARFDNQYIERWSPWRDLVILARTAVAAFRGDR